MFDKEGLDANYSAHRDGGRALRHAIDNKRAVRRVPAGLRPRDQSHRSGVRGAHPVATHPERGASCRRRSSFPSRRAPSSSCRSASGSSTRSARRWARGQGLDPTGSFRSAWVNVSGRQLRAVHSFPAVVEAFAEALRDLRADPRLGLELDGEHAHRRGRDGPGPELRRQSKRSAFVVANRRLRHGLLVAPVSCCAFRVDILKIDRTFVKRTRDQRRVDRDHRSGHRPGSHPRRWESVPKGVETASPARGSSAGLSLRFCLRLPPEPAGGAGRDLGHAPTKAPAARGPGEGRFVESVIAAGLTGQLRQVRTAPAR